MKPILLLLLTQSLLIASPPVIIIVQPPEKPIYVKQLTSGEIMKDKMIWNYVNPNQPYRPAGSQPRTILEAYLEGDRK